MPPLPVYAENLSLQHPREQFFNGIGFRVEDYSAPTYTVKILGVPLKFPNTKAHRWATPLHDLHHILTGYRPDWIGEAEIGAWELRAGCRTLVVYWLDLSGVVIGMLLAPGRVLRAFRAAKGCRTLYRNPELCEPLLRMTLPEARVALGIPPGGMDDRGQ